MKKVVVVMFLLGLAVVSAQAQSPGDRMIASEGMKLFTATRAQQAAKSQAARSTEKAVIEAVKAQEGVDAKNKQAIEKSSAEATKILESLVAGYPGNDALKQVVAAHKDLIARGTVTGTEEFVAQNMFLGQENLVRAAKRVTAENEQLGKIVTATVHHRYYVEVKGEGYTLQQISAWAHNVFPNLPYSEDELK